MTLLNKYPTSPKHPHLRISLNRSNLKILASTVYSSRFIEEFVPSSLKQATKFIRTNRLLLKHYYGNPRTQYYKRLFQLANLRTVGAKDQLVNFTLLLERRLDIVVARTLFTTTLFQGKQLINHGFILVNGRPIHHSAYYMAPGDLIHVHNSILLTTATHFLKHYANKWA